MKKVIIKSILLLFFIASVSLAQERNIIDIDFDSMMLKDIIFSITENTGSGFIINEQANIPINWSQKGIKRQELTETFLQVIAANGLTWQELKNNPGTYIIRNESTIIEGSINKCVGVYQLQSSEPEAFIEAGEKLYSTKLSISFIETNRTIVYSGSESIVKEFTELLSKIDKPVKNDILSIKLDHISVKTAIQALTDTKISENNSFYPDYWNRSVIVKGSPYIQSVALDIIRRIDKPSEGWINHIESVYTMDIEALASVIESSCENVIARKISENKILLSGNGIDVEQAKNLIQKIEGTGKQVKIEAVIAYLTQNEFKEIGLKAMYDSSFKFAINESLASDIVTGNSGLLLQWFKDALDLRAGIQEGTGKGRIISSPVLTVINGQEAKIHMGQNVPFISNANVDKNDGETTGTSISRQDVGITFTVKPVIEPERGFIRVYVKQEVSDVATESEISQSAIDIIVNKKEIESTVLMADGETIFLGGTQSEETGYSETYVPVLRHIPLLGKLFSHKSETTETRNLIISLRVSLIERI